jgi:hypothetical protein
MFGSTNVTTVIGLAAFVVAGIILADALAHPNGVTAAANGLVSVATPTYAALLGQAPAGYTSVSG